MRRAPFRVLKGSRPASDHGTMRHPRLWLLMIGLGSLLAEAIAAAAILGRDALPGRDR
jgi:hypothetical protein